MGRLQVQKRAQIYNDSVLKKVTECKMKLVLLIFYPTNDAADVIVF